jgi:hypothetical protein
MRFVVMYGAVIWLIREKEEMITTCKRKIMRILKRKRNNDIEWKTRANRELKATSDWK